MGCWPCRETTVRPRSAAWSEIVAFGPAPARSPSSGPAQRVESSDPPGWSTEIVSVRPRIVADGAPSGGASASAHSPAGCPATERSTSDTVVYPSRPGLEGEEGHVADPAVPPVGLDAQVARSGAKHDRPRIAAQPGGGATGGSVAVERNRELARHVDRDVGLRHALGAARNAEGVQERGRYAALSRRGRRAHERGQGDHRDQERLGPPHGRTTEIVPAWICSRASDNPRAPPREPT